MRYFAKIRYVGTDFCGFQTQKNGRTVQGELNAATARLFGCECRITGCSRTDSGVHAEDFCLTIEPASPNAPPIPPTALPAAMLPHLPHDISLVYATEAPEGFHPRYDTVGKIYRYRMRYGGMPDPFLHGRVWQLPYALSEGALFRMQGAAPLLLGTHDFSAFMCGASDVEDRVRTVTRLTVEEEADEVILTVAADGFLYNMVRIITGTLFEIGLGVRAAESIPQALASRDRRQAGMTAPPDGLYLHKVLYPEVLSARLGLE